MKTLLTLFVLLFSSSVLAEDISDFEIEGMSIGDSLLDYVSKKEIISHQENYFPDKDGKFVISAFDKTFFSKLYDWIQVGYKSNDNNFKIHLIDGVISYSNNIKDCYYKQNTIIEDLSVLFKDAKWEDSEFEDEDGFFTNYYTFLKSGEIVVVSCYDWNSEMEKKYFDHLKVYISSKEFDDW